MEERSKGQKVQGEGKGNKNGTLRYSTQKLLNFKQDLNHLSANAHPVA